MYQKLHKNIFKIVLRWPKHRIFIIKNIYWLNGYYVTELEVLISFLSGFSRRACSLRPCLPSSVHQLPSRCSGTLQAQVLLILKINKLPLGSYYSSFAAVPHTLLLEPCLKRLMDTCCLSFLTCLPFAPNRLRLFLPHHGTETVGSFPSVWHW